MKRIAVLLSNKGTGSNLQAILDAIKQGNIQNGKVVVVLSDKEEAYGLVRAKKRNIHTAVLSLKQFQINGKTRAEYDETLAKLLQWKYKIDLVVLAGWMLILSKNFIEYFTNRTINLHPGLLPDGNEKYITLSDGTKIKVIRGLHTNSAVQYALDHNFPVTGSTVHFITPLVDTGPVILRSEVKILPGDTVESLYHRMKEEEYKILPQAINLYCNGKLTIINGKVIIKK